MKRNLKILIAPDSFKGSISALDAAKSIERGLQRGFGDAIHADILCITPSPAL